MSRVSFSPCSIQLPPLRHCRGARGCIYFIVDSNQGKYYGEKRIKDYRLNSTTFNSALHTDIDCLNKMLRHQNIHPTEYSTPVA